MGVVEFSADSWQASSPGLGKGLSRRVEVLSELAQGLEALAASDRIGGVGADAMRAYIREVQLPVVQSLLVGVSTFQTAIGVYWNGYAQVDADGNFRLVRDEFDAHLTQVDVGLGQLRGFQDALVRISAGASHLVALGGAGAGAVGATVAEFEGMRAIAGSQRETWEAYEASDPGFNQVKELIGELKGVLKDLGSVTVGRGRSYTAGSFDLTLERLGELTAGMLEYCQANQRAASDGWEAMFSGYAADVEARAEAERREKAGWDLLWDGLQIVAGALITVVGLGLTPFTGGFSLGLTVLGGSLLVGGINNAINHASIATTGAEFNLVGMASEAVGHWYEVNIAQSPLVKGSVGLQFLVGAGSAVGDMVAGGLQVNVKEIGEGVSALLTDPDTQARVFDQLSHTWNQIVSGDAYVAGYATATVASVLIPGVAAVKASRAGGLIHGAGKMDGLVPPAVKLSTPRAATSALDWARDRVGAGVTVAQQPIITDVRKATNVADRAGNAAGSSVAREALNGIPGVSVVGDSVYINGVEKLTTSEWEAIRKASVHNTSASEATLGKWEGRASENSYTNRAISSGTQYFDLGDDWMRIAGSHGLKDDNMFDLFNRPFLDDLILDGKPVRFTHSPEGDPGALGKELKYLTSRDYVYDRNTMTARKY